VLFPSAYHHLSAPFSFCSTGRRPLCAPLFPYTTLFRSVRGAWVRRERLGKKDAHRRGPGLHSGTGPVGAIGYAGDRLRLPPEGRSEEHTSELQSRENLVCRLLLEKQKTQHEHATETVQT